MNDATHVLAEGKLNWTRFEKVTRRFGAVMIETGRGEHAAFDAAPVGAHGTLVAEVLELRPRAQPRDHGGRGRWLKKTQVGDRVELGYGELFVTHESRHGWGDYPGIGVKPLDDRVYEWLSEEALQRCRGYIVRLLFEVEAA